MIETGIIAGGGGGKSGSGGGGLSESSDTLKSTSYAQVLDLICEGEIGGLVDGLKSIYVDDTPLQNPDGSDNFSGVTYIATTGTQSQSAITGFDQVRNEVAVGVEAKISTGPVVRTITNANVTSVAVTVQLPSLTYMDSKGNLGGTTVEYAIDIQTDGGGWVTKIEEVLNGKTSSPYERQYRINLPAGTTRQVRLRRITGDSTSSQLNNKTYWKSYTEIIDALLRYPNSAIVGVKIDASQFRSIPRRGYDVKLLKVRIPTNATVRTDGSLSYTGSWDGTFQIAWTTCPAFCYYDMLTNDRYGLGAYIDTNQVDKWALYTISRYCNELVSDGFGSTEPRFACNVWLNNRQEAYTVINQMTSIFRGMSYWATGSVTAVSDLPKDPTYLFTNANVADGMFSYQGSSAKARHTVALVTWNDPSDMYRQKVEYVEDTAGIARYGVIETEVVAVGCTSRGQAHRVGRWLLYTEQYETEVVSFKAGGDGALCSPGDIIKVADRDRTQNRVGGRVVSATGTTITVDAVGTVPAGAKTLYVIGTDGLAQTRTVSTVVGNVITVTTAFGSIPAAQSVWAMSGTATDVQTFRVMGVAETDEGDHEITALEYYPGKYSLIEGDLALTERVYTDLNPVPATPTGLTLAENTYEYQNTTRSKITVSWTAATNATTYRVEWRLDKGNYQSVDCDTQTFDILDTIVGTYDIRVSALNSLGTPSSGYATGSITTVGNSSAPTAVSDLTATGVTGGILLGWSSTGAALWQAEIYENTANNSASSTLIATISATAYTRTNLVPADGARYYWVKLVNTSGVKSAFSNVASATASSSGVGPAGAPGVSATSASLTVTSASLVAYANGTVVSFSPASGQIKVYSGGTDVTAGSTFAVSAQNSCTGSVNSSGAYSVTAMSADTASLVMTATYSGVSITLTLSLSKSYVGYEIVSALPSTNLFAGRVVYLTTDGKLYRYTGSAWTTAVATTDLSGTVTDAQIAALAASKVTGQLSDSQIAAVAATKVSGQLTDSQIAAVSAAKLSGSMGGGNLLSNTSYKSVSGTLNVDGSLPAGWNVYNNGGIANTTRVVSGGPFGVNYVRLTANVATSSSFGIYTTGGAGVWTPGMTYIISFWARAGNAGGAGKTMYGLYSNMGFNTATQLANPALINGTWQRYAWRVTPASNAATASGELFISYELGSGWPSGAILEVCGVQVEQGEVLTAYAPRPDEILAGTITATEISNNAVTSDKILAGAVIAGKINTDAVTAGTIAAGAVIAGKIATDAVTAGTIAAGAVIAGKIATDAVTAGTIAAGAVVAGKLAANAVTATTIEAGAVVAGKIATNAVTAGTIAAGAITAGKIEANTITANEIATNAITANEIDAGAVTAAKISVTSLSAITATIGTLRTATTGARTEIRDNVIKVYDASNVLRVQLGDLSL